jgi:hypothetical protein
MGEGSFAAEDAARAEANRLEALKLGEIREAAKRQGEVLKDNLGLEPGMSVDFNMEPISIFESK